MAAEKKAVGSGVVRTGGITAPRGFSAGGAAAGIKKGETADLALVVSDSDCTAAGTFTTNAVRASCVEWNRRVVSFQRVRAIVANSGNANACTGRRGAADTRRMARATAAACGVKEDQVLVASTGVIGHYLPLEKINAALPALAHGVRTTPQGAASFARAIMTTDTRPKLAAVRTDDFTIGGCAKGSGMIHPNMATMLAFITTDAAVAPSVAGKILREAVDRTFNNLSVDGDMSTNDMVLLCANGKAGTAVTGGRQRIKFEEALYGVCNDLCAQIAADGEGATKRIEVRVSGARSREDARRAAKAVANSNLVKTAMFGNDPNWGRILCAIGYSGAALSEKKIEVAIGGIAVCRALRPVPFPAADMRRRLHRKVVVIDIKLGSGRAGAIAHTCDFSYDYVRINAEYTT